MRIILVNSPLFLFFFLIAPFLVLLPSKNIAVGGLITIIFVAFAVCFKIEGPSYTRLFKKYRNDGEPIFRCRNQSMVLGLNEDCIAQYPSGKENLLAWLDGPEQWPLLALSKKTRLFQWYHCLDLIRLSCRNIFPISQADHFFRLTKKTFNYTKHTKLYRIF